MTDEERNAAIDRIIRRMVYGEKGGFGTRIEADILALKK